MPLLRFKALETAQNRPHTPRKVLTEKISSFYGINTFNRESMRNFLSKDAYKSVEAAINQGSNISRDVANEIAEGMKQWAISRGATHYTHWFQPLTGLTAEKHDAFFDPEPDGTAIEKFSGDSLVQQEPDASSFPNGGLRNTFEARGYTAWDPSSPAFIMENAAGNTLCIPTVFVAYTGEALDYKAPLLKALNGVDKASAAVCQYFDKNVTKVTASLGVEQEYFLVDEALYLARPDLMLSGRTVLGHATAKGQQLDDHYFGSIPERVHAFMIDFEVECLKLGIPLKTRHNEVAPSQFECAPLYEEANLAVDHNQLLMDVMEKIARKHKFRVLLHEKPFAGINGSGKHNNWSLITNTGVNVLSPGNTPKDNLQFLTFFINTIKAVYDNADLLRASIASAGNDHRLGANEAPPAIISIFIGSQLTQVLNEFENPKKKVSSKDDADRTINVFKIPEILVDNTDRNRTSPFAFTGNKFELRAVGSNANCASSMTVLNTIMANQLVQFKKDVDTIIKKGKKKEAAIAEVLRKYIKASKNILFEGNGYSDEWVKEAEKRGLANVKDTPRALDAYVTKESLKLFADNGIYTERELEARHEILLEDYVKRIQIEARIMGDMVYTSVIPSAVEYQRKLSENVASLKAVGLSAASYKSQMEIIKLISDHLNIIKKSVDAMIDERRKANKMTDMRKMAIAYCDKVKAHFDEIRYHTDKLELLVEDEHWLLPKYRELLFVK